jgi:hypothetical protein
VTSRPASAQQLRDLARLRRVRDRIDVVRGETGDQTDQESRSAGHQAAASLTAMDYTELRTRP